MKLATLNITDKVEKNGRISFALFLCILVCFTFLNEYLNRPFYLGHDMRAHYGRLIGLMQAMESGNLPWYINYNGLNQYGYFIKAFYPDLLLYPFALIGIYTDTFTAYRIMIISNTLLTGVISYWVVKRIYKENRVAMIASILYTFCTYRIQDVYMRSAMGEVFAFTILPIIYLGAYEIIKGNYQKWYILTIGMTLLIYAHLLSSVMTVMMSAVFVLIFYKNFIRETNRIKYLLLATLVTMLLSAYFMLPLLEQMGSNTYYYDTNHAHSMPQSLQQFAITVPQLVKSLFDIIPAHNLTFVPEVGVMLILAIASRLFIPSEKVQSVKNMRVLVIVGLVLIFLSTTLFPWQYGPLKAFIFIQFPWRFFIYVSLFFAIAGACYINQLLTSSKRYLTFLGGMLFVLVLVMQAQANLTSYQLPKMVGSALIYEYPENDQSYYGGAEYIPERVPSKGFTDDDQNGRKVNYADTTTIVTHYTLDKGITTFDVRVNKADVLELPMFYYKGYKAYLNDTEIGIVQSEHGLIEIEAQESGKVKVYYSATTIQILSTLVSCLVAIILIVYIIRQKRRKIKDEPIVG